MKKVKNKLESLGENILKQVNKGENPRIEIPIRALSNIVYDKKTGMLMLGNKSSRRFFFNVAHSRKFMQTLLVAAFCKDLIKENIHTSIRDMYYNLKRTLPNSKENTFEEQSESDPIIVDLEVALDVLREGLNLTTDRKGIVAGNVKIKDRGDIINWSKLGSGGWSIPSTVDEIEFKKVDADFVLVIEKNAGFERLHEDKFWKKQNCILIGTGGQPSRGTRLLIQRLNTEYKLPVYVMTDADSIPPDEVVVVRHAETKEVEMKPIGELLKPFMNEGLNREIIDVPWETLAMNDKGEINWNPVEYAYRHRIRKELLEIHTRGRGVIKVTPSHSLFVYRNDKIEVIKASELEDDDYIVVARELPMFSFAKKKHIIVSETLKKLLPKKNWNRIRLFLKNGKTFLLRDAKERDIENAVFVKHVNGHQKIFNRIEIDEDVGWLLGLWVAEGDVDNKYVRIHLSRKEDELKEKTVKIIEKRFNLKPRVTHEGKNKTGVNVSIGSSILSKVFSHLGLSSGGEKKHVPSVILNSPVGVRFAFIDGLFCGDGSVDKYQNVIYFTKSDVLAKQITNLLLSMNVMPTVLEIERGTYLRLPYTRMPTHIRKRFAGKRKLKQMYTNDPIYGLPNTGLVKKISINWMNNHAFPYSVKNNLINQERFADGIETYGIPEAFEEMSEDLEPLVKNSITLVKIKQVIRKEYEGDVFDLAVPEFNSFVGGNGVIFHNSYGWYIYSVIKSGSMSLAHISDRISTPNAKFIGLTISDIYEYDLKKCIIKAKEVDIKRAKELLKYEWFQTPKWQKEIKLMIKHGIKAEIEALSNRGLRFMSEQYLPEKLKKKEFLD